MSGTVAITGASGFVGSAVVRHLAAHGWSIRAGVRDVRAFAPRPGVVPFACNLPQNLDEAALRGADAVVHAAWAMKPADLARAAAVNVEGSRRVLDAARSARVPHVVFVSSCSAHDAAQSDYGRTKMRVERLLDPGRDAIVRPGFVLGDGGGLFGRLLDVVRRSRLVPVFDGGRQPLQTVLDDDLSAAVRRILENRAVGLFVAAEDPPVSMRAFLESLARRCGSHPRYVALPSAPILPLLALAQRLRVPLPVNAENLRGLRGMVRQDPADTRRRLDVAFRPLERSLDALEERGMFRPPPN